MHSLISIYCFVFKLFVQQCDSYDYVYNKNEMMLLKFISQYTSSMKNNNSPYEPLKQSMTNLFIEQFEIDDNFNDHMAQKSLMALTDEDIQKTRDPGRHDNNSSQINRWHNYHLNILNPYNKGQRKKMRLNHFEQRHVSSENSDIDCCKSHFSVAVSLKKELNKLQFPLKEKMLNLEQFNLQMRTDKSKTRNEVKRDIINSKHEIKPMLISRKRITLENNCDNLFKPKNKISNYKKIKRRGFHTLQVEPDTREENSLLQLSRTRQKSFFLPNYEQNSLKIKLRGGSIHHLLVK